MKKVVAHLIRKYLLPRETFVGNQISDLKIFHPIVCCHTHIKNDSFTHPEIYSSIMNLSKWGRMKATLSYKIIRSLTKGEIKYFRNVLIANNASILHMHFCVDARYFLELAGGLNIKSVVSAYGYDVSKFPHQYWGLGARYLKPIFSNLDLFLAMSEDMKNDLIKLGCPENKIIVHYHGIDVERFNYPGRIYRDRGPIKILLCGSLEIKKAQHNVLSALRRLQISGKVRDNFRVDVVGDGPLKGKLQNLVKEWRWGDRVIFYGHIPYGSDRLVEMYRSADIYLLPSITVQHDKEGIPGTIVEAMVAGLPVISTYHAGIPEIIVNDIHGLLVKENNIEELSEALWKLINDRSLRERLGRSAAEKAFHEFNYKNKARSLEEIYESLIE